MIRVTQDTGSNVVEVEVDGEVTAEEFDRALEQMQEAIDRHGKVKVLEKLGTLAMPPIPWSKFWDDLKFGFDHLRDLTHVAVVADQSWVAGYVKILDPLFRAELKVFKLDEIERARQWLKEA